MGIYWLPVIGALVAIVVTLYGAAIFASVLSGRTVCSISVFSVSFGAAMLTGDPLVGIATLALALVGLLAVSGRRATAPLPPRAIEYRS